MAHSKFIEPACRPSELDTYIVRRSILKALRTQLPRFKGTLLDVGCGNMPYKALLLASPSRVSSYIGLDFEDNPIYRSNPDIIWQAGKISLIDDSIDCSIATEVFEHCPDPAMVMNEINRVLCPGGLLFFYCTISLAIA